MTPGDSWEKINGKMNNFRIFALDLEQPSDMHRNNFLPTL